MHHYCISKMDGLVKYSKTKKHFESADTETFSFSRKIMVLEAVKMSLFAIAELERVSIGGRGFPIKCSQHF